MNISNLSEPIKKATLETDSDTIPQLDGPDEGEISDNVKIDNEPVQQERSCPLCHDDVVNFKTESDFKRHILNYHEQMQVLKTFGTEWIEEHTRHFFYMDKNRRKIWKQFLNEHG